MQLAERPATLPRRERRNGAFSSTRTVASAFAVRTDMTKSARYLAALPSLLLALACSDDATTSGHATSTSSEGSGGSGTCDPGAVGGSSGTGGSVGEPGSCQAADGICHTADWCASEGGRPIEGACESDLPICCKPPEKNDCAPTVCGRVGGVCVSPGDCDSQGGWLSGDGDDCGHDAVCCLAPSACRGERFYCCKNGTSFVSVCAAGEQTCIEGRSRCGT
jgi:hypothetical protein